jgi:hypothetical protein
MDTPKNLITQLGRLAPRLPSPRVRERLFGPTPVPPRPRAASRPPGWMQALVPLGASSLCSLFLALWTGTGLPGSPEGLSLKIRPGLTVALSGVAAPEHPPSWHAAPSRLEWTNRGPSLTSRPSLPQGVTNRLR